MEARADAISVEDLPVTAVEVQPAAMIEPPSPALTVVATQPAVDRSAAEAEKARARLEDAMRLEREQSRRQLRRMERHGESLQHQLDAARAAADRQRDRADKLERQLRELTRVGGGAASATQASPATSGVSQAEHDRVLDQVRDLTLLVDQLRGERDQARAHLHQVRQRSQAAVTLGGFESPQKPIAQSPSTTDAPSSFEGLPQWIDARLDAGRVYVHGKAVRAARKSVFRDPPLAYRVLRAINDWYWPMKYAGDAAAAAKWEDFLTVERLTCNPVGAALENRLTRETYQVPFEGHRYPLDMHVQGNNSRKEEESFRLYFHATRDQHRRVLVGHFPTHLPNSHT